MIKKKMTSVRVKSQRRLLRKPFGDLRKQSGDLRKPFGDLSNLETLESNLEIMQSSCQGVADRSRTEACFCNNVNVVLSVH